VEEGQEIAAGDVLAEIETDKATMDWESQDDGYVAKILVAAGTKDIKVNTVVGIIVEEKDDAAAFADYQPGEGGDAAPASSDSGGSDEKAAEPSGGGEEQPEPASGGGGGGGGNFPPHIMLNMPALSPTMESGNIAAWKVKVGDEVAAGDSLAEVETDKATMDWESQDDGFIAQLLVGDGTKDIKVNTPLAVIVEEKDDVGAFESFSAADAEGKAPPPKKDEPKADEQPKQAAPEAAKQESQQPAPSKPSGGRVVASPYAKKLAREAGVDVADATPTGLGGRIVAADVEQLVKSGGKGPKKQDAKGPKSPAPSAQGGGAEVPQRREGGFTDLPNSNIRRITAQRLLESKQTVPHYYVTVAARMDKLMALRKQINEALAAAGGAKLSVNDFVVKASALALRDVPEVNSAWMGDFIRQYHSVDVSVAVQTPNGLMVPVVRNTDTLGLQEINAAVKQLANKAKDNKLKPDEMTGGTFTISNLGMFGVDQFAAIINPPQVAILAVGSAMQRVVPAPAGGFETASYMNVTLSCDHRVVDGALGAQWLGAFKKYIEDPLNMLV
jgi:pyruvate dehydrogenase E2 component (dihydrolipoamide acetyltransferase)